MNRRGLSDVIAVTLIILLTIAAIVIVWSFIRSLLIGSTEEVDIGALTTSFKILAKSVKLDDATKHIEFNIERGPGSGEVVGLRIILEDSEGNSDSFDGPAINPLETKHVEIYYAGTDLMNARKISVAPIVRNAAGENIQSDIISVNKIGNPNNFQYSFSESGLIGYWDFEDDLIDKSGNGNNGVPMNGPTYVVGKIGKAMEFDGLDDYVSVSDTNNLLDVGSSGSVSISFWINSNVWSTIQRNLVCKGDGPYNYCVYVDSSGANLYLNTANIVNPLITNMWQHVVIVYNNGNTEFYIDGGVEGSVSGVIGSANNNQLYIGWNNVLGQYFNGAIDELRIYNRELSIDEINGLYEQGA